MSLTKLLNTFNTLITRQSSGVARAHVAYVFTKSGRNQRNLHLSDGICGPLERENVWCSLLVYHCPLEIGYTYRDIT